MNADHIERLREQAQKECAAERLLLLRAGLVLISLVCVGALVGLLRLLWWATA